MIIKTSPRLEMEKALKKSMERLAAMTQEERDAMYKAQAESWVRAEMGWPEAKYEWVNGVKVYASYEDYCA